AFYSQAKETKIMFLKIMKLYQDFLEEIKKQHPKIYSADLVQQIFHFPVLTPVRLGNKLGIHYTTASRHLYALTKSGHLQNTKAGKYHFFAN
ncbi:MAG TPA: hypothetical protein DF383_06510, partial [Deltaproteobacteria bacterium]|nr:hypothetical protein [Deltaproteobacteria bacterium]